MFKLPKLAGNGSAKRRTPLVFISQPGPAVLIVTSPGSAFTRRFPLCQRRSRQRRSRQRRQCLKRASGSCHWRYYLPHGIQIRWKFNFARIHFTDRVIATITRHLCCCGMCITLCSDVIAKKWIATCKLFMISHRILMIEQLYFVIADKVMIIYRYLGLICFYHLA